MISAWWLLAAFLAGAISALTGLYFYGSRTLVWTLDTHMQRIEKDILEKWGET